MMSPPSKTKNNETATFYGWRRRIDLLQLVVKENQYSPYRGGQVAGYQHVFFLFLFPSDYGEATDLEETYAYGSNSSESIVG